MSVDAGTDRAMLTAMASFVLTRIFVRESERERLRCDLSCPRERLLSAEIATRCLAISFWACLSV